MTKFLVRRIALVFLVAIGVITFMFALTRLSGDPATVYAPVDASADVLAATRARLGLDRPLLTQYVDSVTGAFTLDFGDSFSFRRPAFDLVRERLVPSLVIILPALVIAVLTAFAVGTVAALRPTRLSGRLIMVGAFMLQGMPYFWMALLLVLLLSINWHLLPATGSSGWQSLVIPIGVLGTYGVSTLSRLVRGQLLDTLGQGHVLTARSKGLAARTVLFRHALPSALPPLLAWSGIQFAFMFGALLVLEPILDYQGLGSLLVRSVSNRDFPMVQAGIFTLALIITLVNLGIDVMIRLVDPRLRSEATT